MQFNQLVFPSSQFSPMAKNKNISQGSAKKHMVCFSFAAYAKILINHLKSTNIPIERGLNDAEIASIEATFNFTFPPDLRSILHEGLPVGPGFPNWQASSAQQLNILLDLPALGLLKQVSKGTLWCPSWGPRLGRGGVNAGLEKVKGLLRKAPVLVPVYRNCYIPCEPNLAGNPVFYIDSESARVLSFDVTGFFREFGMAHAPSWTPKEARRVEFWSEVAARGDTRGWWSGKLGGGCLDEVCRRLREGGWKEEEVREMMMMDGSGAQVNGRRRRKEDVGWRVELLSVVLLRGGWTREDVVYSLGLHDQDGIWENGVVAEKEGRPEVDVEYDCAMLVAAVTCTNDDLSDMGRLVEDCKALLASFPSTQVRHIFREANCVVNRFLSSLLF